MKIQKIKQNLRKLFFLLGPWSVQAELRFPVNKFVLGTSWKPSVRQSGPLLGESWSLGL